MQILLSKVNANLVHATCVSSDPCTTYHIPEVVANASWLYPGYL